MPIRKPDQIKKYTEANREAWNEVMPKHQKAAREKWDIAFQKPGFVCLFEHEVALIKKFGIQGKSVAHLCCNNGIELLSIKNLGAGECVGFDISDPAIQEAKERAEKNRIECQFVRTDVYDIGPEYEKRFDFVYVSAGGLGWMPDIKLFFQKATALLKENGRIFIHEIHPFSEMLPFDGDEPEEFLKIIEPYFKKDPYIDYGGLDYVGGTEHVSDKPQYWFVHTLSDIIMGMIENGVDIEHFYEYEKDISAGHQKIEKAKVGVPLSYILVGEKKPL
jgi:ubiquinone/menaquinone biosynthesis C-methylase UbiE